MGILHRDRIIFIYYFFICIFISLLFSVRDYNTTISWVQNDTNNYYLYFNCLKNESLSVCNSIIGINLFEITLPIIAIVSNIFTGEHYLMFFITSMLFFISLFFFYQSLGRYSLLILPLVIFSPSFWEFELNIIRNSLACSFFLLSLSSSIYLTKSKNIFVTLTLFSHTSGFMYFIAEKISKIIDVRFLFLFLFFIISFSIDISDFFISLVAKIPYLNATTIIRKLVAYSQLGDNGINVLSVVGKVYLFITFFLYFDLKSGCNGHSILLYKILLFILIIGCFLQGTSVMYRVINIYIFIIFYLVVFGVKEKKQISYFLYFICFLWVCFDFYKNYMFYIRYLQ